MTWTNRDYLISKIILEYSNKRDYRGTLQNSVEVCGNNPGCTDSLILYFRVQDDKVECKFTGSGCTLSMGIASILMELINEKTVNVAKNINLESVASIVGEKMLKSRINCSSLALRTLKKAISIYETEVN